MAWSVTLHDFMQKWDRKSRLWRYNRATRTRRIVNPIRTEPSVPIHRL